MSATRVAAALCALALVGAARDPLAGRVAGTPVDCIDLSLNSAPIVVGPRTILYRQSGRRIWRTQPVGDCTRLRTFSKLIVDDFSGGRICANDRFRVLQLDQIIPSGFCRFDQFTPYDKPDASAGR